MPAPIGPPEVTANDITRDSTDLDNAFTVGFKGVDLTVDQEGVIFKLDGSEPYRVWAYKRTGALGDYGCFGEADLTNVTGSTVSVEASASGKTNSDTANINSPGSGWLSKPSASASDEGGGSWKISASPGSSADGHYLVVMPLTDQPGTGTWSSYLASGGWAEVSSGSADVTVTAASGDEYAVFLVDGDPSGTSTPVVTSPADVITL